MPLSPRCARPLSSHPNHRNPPVSDTMSSTEVDSCLHVAERVGLAAVASGSNFVLSPLSIRAALGLAAAGASGETLHQMLSFLGSPTVDHLNSASARLMASVRGDGDCDGRVVESAGPRLSFVNGVWVDRSLTLKPGFDDVAASVYGAVTKSVDFRQQANEVAKEVNEWVQKETNGLIDELIPDGAVDGYTRLILANALYFKGVWADKFDASGTRHGTFHLLDNSTVQVPFMTSRRDQFISSFDGFKVLKLRYRRTPNQRSLLYMLIFLPDKKDGLPLLIHKLSSDPNFIKDHTPRRDVEVGNFMIPKFNFVYEFEASKVLADLGMEAPFDGGHADFREMVSDLTPRDNLFISSVHHRARIEVDEEGTTAAAATAVLIRAQCYRPPVDFSADHPFMFAIMEEESEAVLFLGHVVNPLVD